MIIASLSVIAFDSEQLPTHPGIVMILRAGSPGAGALVCANDVADVSSVTPNSTAVYMGPPLVTHERANAQPLFTRDAHLRLAIVDLDADVVQGLQQLLELRAVELRQVAVDLRDVEIDSAFAH